MRSDFKTAKYEERLTERTAMARRMEDQRDQLNAEVRSLSLRADSRARLDLKRAEFKSKSTDLKNTYVFFRGSRCVMWSVRDLCLSRLDLHNAKYRALVGSDALPDVMERDLELVSL
jgi:DNA repair protein RAD50